jgi:hypothetical protein
MSDSILHYNGLGWQSGRKIEIPFFGKAAVWGTSPSNVYVVIADTLYRGNYRGWDPVPIPSQTAERQVDVWGTDSNDVFVLAYSLIQPGFIVYHFDGTAWTRTQVSSSSNGRAIWGTSSSDVYVVGGRTIHHYDGSTWSLMRSEVGDLNGVWGAPTGEVFVVGGGGGGANVILKGTRP